MSKSPDRPSTSAESFDDRAKTDLEKETSRADEQQMNEKEKVSEEKEESPRENEVNDDDKINGSSDGELQVVVDSKNDETVGIEETPRVNEFEGDLSVCIKIERLTPPADENSQSSLGLSSLDCKN